MDLKSYLEREDMRQSDFANVVGVSQSLVSHWVTGVRAISWEDAKKIEAATGGMVSRYELRPDIFGPNPSLPLTMTKGRAAIT